MKSFFLLIALLTQANALAGNFHVFCEHQYVDQNSDTFLEQHYLSTVFEHYEPYSRDCAGVRLEQLERTFKRHLEFIDVNVDLYDGFTSCNCYSRRHDANKAHKESIRTIRGQNGANLRIISDFFGK
ncbi:MAG: hypothetical protein EP326_10520 [Deltaproteobacteria bacterium]|nr:MAG: hypothetical protein EP326_10520 [Deltaproteobacteria bacterium]TNF25271.1 MAG: hypothetical protein EP319_16615 [Deltaproteobacteria bacterium]